MEIFKLTLDDFNNYLSVIRSFVLESYRVNFDLDIEKIKKISEKKVIELEEYLKEDKAILFGAKEGERLVGLLWCFVIQTESEKKIHINQLIVDQKYRGMGIATQLLKFIEQYAFKVNILKLELNVTVDNIIAKELYLKNGYKPERVLLSKVL